VLFQVYAVVIGLPLICKERRQYFSMLAGGVLFDIEACRCSFLSTTTYLQIPMFTLNVSAFHDGFFAEPIMKPWLKNYLL